MILPTTIKALVKSSLQKKKKSHRNGHKTPWSQQWRRDLARQAPAFLFEVVHGVGDGVAHEAHHLEMFFANQQSAHHLSAPGIPAKENPTEW